MTRISALSTLSAISMTALLGTLGSTAGAQTAQDIINKVDATLKATKDVSFRMTGQATLEANTQKIDFTVKSIPAQNLVRLQFVAPDALADNIVVADKNEVRQYMYLTNQITVTSTKKAADTAGFGGIDFTRVGNTADLLKDYDVKLLSTTGTTGKRLFQLEATPKSGSGDKTRLWVTEAGWRPTRVQVITSAGKTLADMNVANYKANSGLSAASLRALPKDAEIIKQ